MWTYALPYLVFAIVFGLMDFVWLSTAVPRIYQPALGEMLAEKVRAAPAALFYLTYVAGVVFFVLAPTVAAGDWKQAALRGAALGLVAYATYDLTNQATLSVWPTRLTVIDLSWGVFATAVASTATVLISHRIAKAVGWN
jgi:uncharacterized membrane protein